jgi:hypothetical protein
MVLADYAVWIWIALFAASFLSSIVAGIIQHWRGKSEKHSRRTG